MAIRPALLPFLWGLGTTFLICYEAVQLSLWGWRPHLLSSSGEGDTSIFTPCSSKDEQSLQAPISLHTFFCCLSALGIHLGVGYLKLRELDAFCFAQF